MLNEGTRKTLFNELIKDTLSIIPWIESIRDNVKRNVSEDFDFKLGLIDNLEKAKIELLYTIENLNRGSQAIINKLNEGE
jgi:hypothetical protein